MGGVTLPDLENRKYRIQHYSIQQSNYISSYISDLLRKQSKEKKSKALHAV